MRRIAQATIASIFAFLLAVPAVAAKDIDGAADHPLVGRYAGSEIDFYEKRAYDEVMLPDRVVPAGKGRAPESWTIPLKGAVTSIRYKGPEGRSALEVMRNYQQALEKGGFETVVFCAKEDCVETGGISSLWDEARGGIGMPTTWDTSVYLLVRNGSDYVALLSVETGSAAAVVPHIAVTVVEAGDIEDEQITLVEASEMNAAFARDGRIAIYGFYFEFDSAALQPQSDAQVTELARLLDENTDLAVIVVGHTDSIGDFRYNLDLSQRRAQAVVDVLVDRHGIAVERLTPAGAGMVSPVSTNRTPEGRRLNRRVEIVEVFAGPQ